MLLEPSSGSYSRTYFPLRRSSRTFTGIGCSSSSDATMQTRPVCSTLWRTVSCAKRASFCCTSPCTLIAPTSPRISVTAGRRRWPPLSIPPPPGEPGRGRAGLVEPAVRRRPARAVMPHLEQHHSADLPRQVRLGRQPRVSREQQPARAVRHQQDDGLLVDVGLTG